MKISIPRGLFNIKVPSFPYRKSNCWYKTILQPPYLHETISYIGKTTFHNKSAPKTTVFTLNVQMPESFYTSSLFNQARKHTEEYTEVAAIISNEISNSNVFEIEF